MTNRKPPVRWLPLVSAGAQEARVGALVQW
jgi:hypothetical protein